MGQQRKTLTPDRPAQDTPAAATSQAAACGTGHTIAALYVNPDDGTYQVRYGLADPNDSPLVEVPPAGFVRVAHTSYYAAYANC